MLRFLILFFTLNALMLPVSGYASMPMSEMDSSMVIASTDADSGEPVKCQMMMVKACHNCDMGGMDTDCDSSCCSQCASHVASIPSQFITVSFPAMSGQVITKFKYYYLHTTSPEQRPPLV